MPSGLVGAAAGPISRYPAWAIDEYAGMRLWSVCTTARTAPTSMVSTATAAIAGRQSSTSPPSAPAKTRRKTAKPAALVPAAMKAVTGVGAPWYTSGVHMWKGTAATLKQNPTASSATPASSSDKLIWVVAVARAMAARLVVLVAP